MKKITYLKTSLSVFCLSLFLLGWGLNIQSFAADKKVGDTGSRSVSRPTPTGGEGGGGPAPEPTPLPTIPILPSQPPQNKG